MTIPAGNAIEPYFCSASRTSASRLVNPVEGRGQEKISAFGCEAICFAAHFNEPRNELSADNIALSPNHS
jgi:hypothetical protein